MIESLVVTGFQGSAIHAGGHGGQQFLAGRSSVRDAIFHLNGGHRGIVQVDAVAAPHLMFRDLDPDLRNVRYEHNPDPRPAVGSPALANADAELPEGVTRDALTYTGAFGSWDWTAEWTVSGPESDHAVGPASVRPAAQ